MASTIAAITTGVGGVVTTADATGNLNLLAGTTTVVALTTAGAAVSGTLSNTTGATFATSSGNVGVGTGSPSSKLHVVSSSGENKIISEATAASQQASMSLIVQAATPGQTVIYMGKTGATTNGQLGYDPNTDAMTMFTNNAERMRIDSSGNLLVGTTSTNPVASRVNGSVINSAGGIFTRSATSSSYYGLNVTSGTHINFYTDNGSTFVVGGNIATNGATTSYNATSDYRLKENVQLLNNALSRVAQLRPVTWTWKDGYGGTQPSCEGFIAHELAEILPIAVTGEKDATREEEYEVTPSVPAVVDAEGVETTPAVQAVKGTRTVPSYQGVDTSFLVATLTAAIQEQQALILALTDRIAALEAK